MIKAVRGTILHFLRDPGAEPDPAAWELFEDGCLVFEAGYIRRAGNAADILPTLPPETPVEDYRGKLILPGFIDVHVHSAQVDVIASYGKQLLDWLNDYTFPAEGLFADPAHAAAISELFLDYLLMNGTTTAAVFPTVHKASTDAFFAAAQRRKLRMIAGKVMMDRHCPEFLRDDVASAEADTRDLIARWHRNDRLLYALTPRFAPTSSPLQLQMAGRLFSEYPDLHLQTHLAENHDEIAWVKELFPEAHTYLEVYDYHCLLGERAIFAHCLHLEADDRERMADAGAAMAFCPSSNLFIGSGLFDLAAARDLGIRVGLGTDVGGGTSYSMLQTLADGYKALMLNGQRLNAWRGFYLATRGGAEALRLEKHIGNFQPGREADFVVLDFAATPILRRRTEISKNFEERLFALMILGDDRAVAATYVMGEAAYRRKL